MQKISVLLPNAFAICTYFAQKQIEVGTFVKVPFAKQEKIGVVWNSAIDNSFPESKIKPILNEIDLPILKKENIDFINWVSKYNLANLGVVFKMLLPIEGVEKPSKKPLYFPIFKNNTTSMTFSNDQQKAISFLCQQQGFITTLLDGVTGSGKTEVYFEVIQQTLKKSKQILVLLPEITLTSNWLERFEKRFGIKPACWHSGLTPKIRKDTWRSILSNEAQVVVGARSALFLPYPNLGLIVVDEEHDASYKQEDGAIYQARDMAIVRAKIGKFPIILASATPSLETYCNVLSHRYQSVQLPQRFAKARLPDFHIIDMRSSKKTGTFSAELISAIQKNLEQKNQTLLFLNRRGYAPIRLCKKCGEKIKCPHCSVLMTEHRHMHRMLCHQCGYTRPIPKTCPECGTNDSFISCGAGVEKIEEEIKSLFQTAHVEIVTSDTVSSPQQFEEIINRLSDHSIDILIGTQMLAKGHNFPDLTVIGIMDADFSLTGGDLRASERTFQLLQQVSGRAGRATKRGETYLQTYSPENNVIHALKNQNRNDFMETEKNARKLLSMPPYGRLGAIIISGKTESFVQKHASLLIKKAPFLRGVEFLGPVQAPLYRLRGKFRYRILIKSEKKIALQKIITDWLGKVTTPSSIQIKIDIDPYSFL